MERADWIQRVRELLSEASQTLQTRPAGGLEAITPKLSESIKALRWIQNELSAHPHADSESLHREMRQVAELVGHIQTLLEAAGAFYFRWVQIRFPAPASYGPGEQFPALPSLGPVSFSG